jgi:hypothetical protein
VGASLVLAAFSAACSDKNKDADGGEAGAATGNVLDQCTKIGTAYCTAAQQCGQLIDNCVSQFNEGCCGPANASKCTADAITPDSDINACANGIHQLTCAQISLPALPANCNNIPETP